VSRDLRFNGGVLGGAGRATYWFTPYVSSQLDAQAEGTSYDVPSNFSSLGAGHFSNHNYLIAGHMNARSQQQGLIGLFAGAGDAGGIFGGSGISGLGGGSSQRHVIFGAEGQYYFNNFTAYLQGGYDTTVNTVGFRVSDINAWFVRGTGRYFVTPNLMLEGTGQYANGKVNLDTSGGFPPDFPTSIGFQTWLWQAKAEWRFDTMPFSVFAKYQGSQTKYDQIAFSDVTFNTKTTDNRFLLGLRLYMGESTLLSNDRKGSTLDIIDPLGTATGPLMFGNRVFSCFTATTQVLMADGTTRPIAEVKVGDQVLGENGEVNRVVEVETPVLGTRKLYAFNDGPAFVTPEHPFMTRTGWKSMAPDATFAEHGNFVAGPLTVGDDLVRLETIATRAKPMTVALGGSAPVPSVEVAIETRFAPLESTTPHEGDPAMRVYNLRLDGNHTYFANSYLVHNK
jgi:hypothetical protein